MTVEIIFKHNFKEKKLNFNGKLNYFGYKIKNDFLKEYGTGIKTGRKYGSHIASAPDETPARITGRLGNSLHMRVAKNELLIADTSGYGAYLEFGTKRIKARKGVVQAIDKNKENFKNDISRISK
jgi:hypothetical protein